MYRLTNSGGTKGKWYLCWGEGLEEGGVPHYLTFPVAFGYSDVLAAWLQVDGHCITIGLVGHLEGGEEVGISIETKSCVPHTGDCHRQSHRDWEGPSPHAIHRVAG